jgi:hypothetical protein
MFMPDIIRHVGENLGSVGMPCGDDGRLCLLARRGDATVVALHPDVQNHTRAFPMATPNGFLEDRSGSDFVYPTDQINKSP